VLARPLDITQIALACALGYADFRFPDCNWRTAFPKLAAFNAAMQKRPSVATRSRRRHNRSGAERRRRQSNSVGG